MSTDSSAPAVAVRGLVRRFGATNGRSGDGSGFTAVREVSFDVRRGEVFALLGTNGAGKTSTVEVLVGLARATAGEVRVLGEDPWLRRTALRSRVGVVLQDAGLPQDLTVAETLGMWVGTLSRPLPPEGLLRDVGLTHRRDVRVRQLSGGERRRLDLAMALAGRPEVLFLDEPTTGLDPEGRQDTWRLVQRLRDAGTAILLTTHYLEEAAYLADRLAIMHGGRIVTTGTPADVVAAYPAVIGFRAPAASAASLPALPGLREAPAVGEAGDSAAHVTLRCDDLQVALTALLRWAAADGVRLDDLSARPASLEEAFLAIAGHPAAEPGRVAA